MYFVIKCVISGLLVGLISEVSRRSSLVGAVTASLPLTSILALIWLYRDTGSPEKIVALSNGIALIVLPSILFFVFLSVLVGKFQVNFYVALAASCAGMAIAYAGYVWALGRLGINV